MPAIFTLVIFAGAGWFMAGPVGLFIGVVLGAFVAKGVAAT